MTSPTSTDSSPVATKIEEARLSSSAMPSAMPSAHLPIWTTSKDEFGGPIPKLIPDSNDVTYFHTNRTLRLFYTQSIQHFANRLQVRALHASPTLFPCTHESTAAEYLLVHQDRFGGPFRAVNVHLKLANSNRDGDSEWTVLIFTQDLIWLPLKQWLTQLPMTEDPASSAEGYDLQHEWCNAVGKPFRFLDLPVELQRQIMLHALGTHVVPLSHLPPWHDDEPESLRQVYESLDHKTYITCGEHEVSFVNFAREAPFESLSNPIPPINKSILYLNKATRLTGLDVLWKDTIKVFRPTEKYVCQLPHMSQLSKVHFGHLRKIELRFEILNYIHLFAPSILHEFDSNPRADPSILSPEDAQFLTDLPLLQQLSLYFQAPINDWRSPFKMHPDIDLTFLGVDYNRFPCQKRILDMVAVLAAEYTHKVKKLVLSGCIKTSTKDLWLRYNRDYMNVDTRAEIEEQKRIIPLMPHDQSPPPCHCSRPCLSTLYNDWMLESGSQCWYHSRREEDCEYCRHTRFFAEELNHEFEEYDEFDHDDSAIPREDFDALRDLQGLVDAVQWKRLPYKKALE